MVIFLLTACVPTRLEILKITAKSEMLTTICIEYYTYMYMYNESGGKIQGQQVNKLGVFGIHALVVVT